MKTTHTTPPATTIPSGIPTPDAQKAPAALNKLIMERAADYITRMNEPAGPLSPRVRALLAQPGFLFRRQAE